MTQVTLWQQCEEEIIMKPLKTEETLSLVKDSESPAEVLWASL